MRATADTPCDGYSRLSPDLSETAATNGDFFDEGLGKPFRARFRMTKAQFEQVMEPFLHIPKEPSEMGDKSFTHSLVAPIWDCLGKAALAPEDLDVLVLHGGSCRNPYVRRELKRLLSDDLSLFSRISACSCSAGK